LVVGWIKPDWGTGQNNGQGKEEEPAARKAHYGDNRQFPVPENTQQHNADDPSNYDQWRPFQEGVQSRW
jgi:hypothetical protein